VSWAAGKSPRHPAAGALALVVCSLKHGLEILKPAQPCSSRAGEISIVSEYGSIQALARQRTDMPISTEGPMVRASSSVMTTGRTLMMKLPWKGVVDVTSSARPSPPIRST
jgi:hypothetical protein